MNHKKLLSKLHAYGIYKETFLRGLNAFRHAGLSKRALGLRYHKLLVVSVELPRAVCLDHFCFSSISMMLLEFSRQQMYLLTLR